MFLQKYIFYGYGASVRAFISPIFSSYFFCTLIDVAKSKRTKK